MGSPPGYVGHDEGGQLTEAVRRRPYSVVLFDEVEKAHPDAFNMLLQIMEDGRLADARGRSVSFANTVVVMTSNVGTSRLRAIDMGFQPAAGDEAERERRRMRQRVGEGLRKVFRPEFLNRLDAIVTFASLDRRQLRGIVDVMLTDVQRRLAERDMTLDVHDDAREALARSGFDPTYGARPLRRTITARIEDPLSERLLRGEVSGGDEVTVTADGGDDLSFEIRHRAPCPVGGDT